MYTKLNWPLYPNLVKMETIGDGNCFFHAIAQCFSKQYNYGYFSDGKIAIDRVSFIRELRENLSDMLDQPRPGFENKTWYQTLGRGQFQEFADADVSGEIRTSLKHLKEDLENGKFVGNNLIEYVSVALGINIFILDEKTKGLYQFAKDNEILFSHDKSVIILYSERNEHFESVGIIKTNTGEIETFFSKEHEIIKLLLTK